MTWSVVAVAAAVAVAATFRGPAKLAASARLADAAGVSPGQAAMAPAAMAARASAEPAAISVIFGVLVEGLAVVRPAVVRRSGGSPSAEGQRGPLAGRVCSVVSTRAQTGHRGCGRVSGVGVRRGDRAPGRSEGGGHHVRGVLAGPTMPETIILVTEKYLLSVMRKVTQSYRSPWSPDRTSVSGAQARGPQARRPLS
jgi:hypothetical protein